MSTNLEKFHFVSGKNPILSDVEFLTSKNSGEKRKTVDKTPYLTFNGLNNRIAISKYGLALLKNPTHIALGFSKAQSAIILKPGTERGELTYKVTVESSGRGVIGCARFVRCFLRDAYDFKGQLFLTQFDGVSVGVAYLTANLEGVPE